MLSCGDNIQNFFSIFIIGFETEKPNVKNTALSKIKNFAKGERFR